MFVLRFSLSEKHLLQYIYWTEGVATTFSSFQSSLWFQGYADKQREFSLTLRL